MALNRNEGNEEVKSFEELLKKKNDFIQPVYNSFLDTHEEKVVDNETYWENQYTDYFEVYPEITPL